MRAGIVYNPIKIDRDELAVQVESAQPLEWSEPVWFETSADDAGEAAVRSALDAGVDLLLVAGGDGTVRVAADAVTSAHVPLAIIPAGTGNLLARNLGIDVTSLKNAVVNAFEGDEREIDLGELEIEAPDGTRSKHAFAVMVGFGLDAEMIEKTDEELKKKVGWLAYVDAAGRVISGLDKVRVQVRLDGGRTTRSTVNTMLIGNCGTVTNGIVVLPDAVVDDGMLDIALIRPQGARGWLQVAGYVARNNLLVTKLLRRTGHLGRQRTGAALGYGQAKETHARLEEPRAVQVDGDVVGDAIALRAGVREDALVVRVPHRRSHEGVAV
ncbi:MAG: diacylglycerol/lipid kinase family protein [Actinomycetes bacterium]|uniref:diacylglycerol/lipid kinase family protein n=1 Tax=unclassified Agrococcus TaxID=2615065 RepID=UPI001FF55004|nr:MULTISPECIES: diacylglycerol kinase family protein [unclassified Agrococcus]MDR7235316.1 diacylglycerol kinase family enzyme [Agrococcus sp. BE272]UOW01414.1 NAD(+)/NADH kinase [Agrococcus sp. SCSIO52902]